MGKTLSRLAAVYFAVGLLLAPALPGAADAGDLGFPLVPAGRALPCGDPVPCDAPLTEAVAFLPGRPFLNPAPPQIEAATVWLPVPGIYVFQTKAGQQTVLATSGSTLVDTNLVFSYATGASTGGSSDDARFYADRERFVRSFFLRSPVALSCGATAGAMRLMLDQLGIASRIVQWLGADERLAAHQSLEVELPGVGWTLYDPHAGLAFDPGTNALDVFNAARRGEALGRRLQLYLHKVTWTPEPWDIYRRLQVAVGQFDGNRIDLLVADASTLRARDDDALGGHAFASIPEAEMLERYYSSPGPSGRRVVPSRSDSRH